MKKKKDKTLMANIPPEYAIPTKSSVKRYEYRVFPKKEGRTKAQGRVEIIKSWACLSLLWQVWRRYSVACLVRDPHSNIHLYSCIKSPY